jgi:hypothetical protein
LLRDFDRSPQAGPTAADYQNVMRGRFHCVLRAVVDPPFWTAPALNTLTSYHYYIRTAFRRCVKRPDYSAAFSGIKCLLRCSIFASFPCYAPARSFTSPMTESSLGSDPRGLMRAWRLGIGRSLLEASHFSVAAGAGRPHVFSFTTSTRWR